MMRLRHNTIQVIAQLARRVVEKCALTSDHESRRERYTYKNIFYQDIAIQFYDVLWPQFDSTVAALYRDPALANRSLQEVHSDVWQLVVELIKDRERYLTDNNALRARVSTFAGQVIRDMKDYEFVFVVEGLSLPDEELRIGKVTFQHFGSERARRWGMVGIVKRSGIAKDVIDHAVGFVGVQAGSFDKGTELAAMEVDRSLSIMRAALASTRSGPPLDEMFLQRRGGYYVAKQLGDKPVFQSGAVRQFTPMMLDLRGSLKDYCFPLLSAVHEVGAYVDALRDGTVPPKLAEALLRALEWIGSSVTRESYDDRIVDLCTAMECMLTTESDALKGEKIALRYILLLCGLRGSLYTYPWATLPIYRRRSKIVHGAGRGIAGPSDYMVMKEIAMKTFTMVFDVIKGQKTIRDIGRLAGFLESDADRIESACFLLRSERSAHDRAIEKYAQSLLERLRGLQAALPADAPE